MKTETGTPVQYLKFNKHGYWDILPAVISKVEEAQVNIIIIGKKSNTEIVGASHADFVRKGKDVWDFLPKARNGQFRNKLFLWKDPNGMLKLVINPPNS